MKYMDENSFMLWHKRLGHISLKIIKRLVKEEIVRNIDFADFSTCIECIKGKHTKKPSKGAKISNELLEIIYIDICGPFPTPCFNGQKYLISFIDDHSRFMYLYLLYEQSEALDAFKVFKAKVEKQKKRK